MLALLLGKKDNMIQIDIIIISFAKDAELKSLTENCVRSLIESEDKILFNIFIIE